MRQFLIGYGSQDAKAKEDEEEISRQFLIGYGSHSGRMTPVTTKIRGRCVRRQFLIGYGSRHSLCGKHPLYRKASIPYRVRFTISANLQEVAANGRALVKLLNASIPYRVRFTITGAMAKGDVEITVASIPYRVRFTTVFSLLPEHYNINFSQLHPHFSRSTPGLLRDSLHCTNPCIS